MLILSLILILVTMKMKMTCLMVNLLFFYVTTYGQETRSGENFTIVFYNVENLFDIEDDPFSEDDEFTPGSEKQWNRERYTKKLDDIAEVLSSIPGKDLPGIIGLCEVENKKVLKDLTGTRKLRKKEYGIVHEDSPDIRGIDVALLYRKDRFDMVDHKSIPVVFPFDTVKTRDILYVKGKTSDSETFHFFVNHWSSRREGEKATERRRVFSAVVLRKAVDSIMNVEADAKIFILGDFNDEPTNISLHSVLNATNKQKNAGARDLYNLMYDKHNIEDLGTYSYKGSWNMLDNLIVSKPVLNDKKGYHLDYSDGMIFREDWMMYDNPKTGDLTLNKTYGGNVYFGGVSDHLPVYMVLKKN